MKITEFKKSFNSPAKTKSKQARAFQKNQNNFTPQKINFISKVSKLQILPISFFIYTVGDLVYLFVNNIENNKNSPEMADKLFCQQLATTICNIVIYWASVLLIDKTLKSRFDKYVEGFKPRRDATKAAENLSAIAALVAGVPINELLKAIGVSKLTNWFHKHFSSFPLWFLKLFNLERFLVGTNK
jgi:hypothetical protein